MMKEPCALLYSNNRKGQVTHVCCRANASRVDMKPVSAALSMFSMLNRQPTYIIIIIPALLLLPSVLTLKYY